MESTNIKISNFIRKELSSVKVMILAIMMSFGVVLSVIQAFANVVYTHEILVYVKEYMRIPYDAENNEMVSLFAVIVWVIQLLLWVVQFALLMLMTYGVYNIYSDARYYDNEVKTKGLKIVGGIMKYYAIMSYVIMGLFIAIGVIAVIAAFGFGDKISSALGMNPYEYAPALRGLAVALVVVVVIVSIIYAGIASVYMSLNNNMKFMAKIQQGKRLEGMSLLGIVLMIIVGVSNLLSISSDLSNSGYSNEDIEMMQEMLGGSVTEFIVNMMPSANTQFRVAVIGCAYAFFIGAAQLIGGITLLGIRKNVNKILEEQEVVNYGGEDFTGGNQC